VLEVVENGMARVVVGLERAAINDFLEQLDWIAVAHDDASQ
jgi:hypothetical protein